MSIEEPNNEERNEAHLLTLAFAHEYTQAKGHNIVSFQDTVTPNAIIPRYESQSVIEAGD